VIVEMRTYNYRPGTVALALDRIALGLPERSRLSPLGGLWQTEYGRLHQIVHIWPYAGLGEREAIRGRFAELRNWPARTGEWTESAETKIMHPAPFSPPLTPRRIGPIYEIRTDTFHSGKLNDIVAQWQRVFAGAPPSSFVGAWSTDLGPMSQWIHIWGYPAIDERPAALQQLDREPALALSFLKQEVAICRPADFSPLQ